MDDEKRWQQALREQLRQRNRDDAQIQRQLATMTHKQCTPSQALTPTQISTQQQAAAKKHP